MKNPDRTSPRPLSFKHSAGPVDIYSGGGAGTTAWEWGSAHPGTLFQTSNLARHVPAVSAETQALTVPEA